MLRVILFLLVVSLSSVKGGGDMERVGMLWVVGVVGYMLTWLVVWGELRSVVAPRIAEAYAVSPVVRGSGGRVVVVCVDGGLLRGHP